MSVTHSHFSGVNILSALTTNDAIVTMVRDIESLLFFTYRPV